VRIGGSTMKTLKPLISSYFLFEKHSTNVDSYIWTHKDTPYLYLHLRMTELADSILKLTKLSHAHRYWRKHHLTLNKYSAFMRRADVKSGVLTLVSWVQPSNLRLVLRLSLLLSCLPFGSSLFYISYFTEVILHLILSTCSSSLACILGVIPIANQSRWNYWNMIIQ
jgi:hypothetical protein